MAVGRRPPPSRLALAGLVVVWSLVVYRGLAAARHSALAPELNYFGVQPLLWLTLAAVAFAAWCFGLRCRPNANWSLILTGALAGAFQVACWLLAGLAFGFGASPFASSPLALVGNMLLVASALLALELSRTVLVAGLSGRPVLAVLVSSLFLTLLRVPPARWEAATQLQSVGPLLGEMLLPYFAEGVLASSLALAGGPLPAILYRGTTQAYLWFSPILPQLPWTGAAFVGTLAPALGLILLRFGPTRAAAESPRDLAGAWPIVGSAFVALLWFNVGLFGVRPTLVSGASMEPALQTGDIAVVRQVPPSEISPGDIVQFQHEGVHVIHRVLEVQPGPNGPVYITKGDANNQLDPPLPAERLDGKVVFVIRKLGWIGITARQVVQWVR